LKSKRGGKERQSEDEDKPRMLTHFNGEGKGKVREGYVYSRE